MKPITFLLVGFVHSAPNILTNLVNKGSQMIELWSTEYTTAPYTVTDGPFEGGLEERTSPAMT